MKADRARRTPFASLLLIAASLSACDDLNAGDGDKHAAAPPEHPVYTAIARGRVDVEGGLIKIAASRDGVIREVYVREGDRVEKDQILAVQDSRLAEVNVRLAAAELDEAKARLPLLRQRLSAADREVRRLTALVADGAARPQDLDEAQDKAQDLRLEITQAELAAASAEARVAVQRFEIEQRTIRAPVDGVIAKRLAQPGVGASTLNVSTLFTLIPDAPRIVRADVEERYIDAVEIGQSTEISPEYALDVSYPGAIRRKGQVLGQKRLGASDDPNERVDERVIEVVIESADLPLLIGQRVLVRFMRTEDSSG